MRYLRLPALFEQLAHGDGSWPRLMDQLLKMDLLILDDWGLQKITAAQLESRSAIDPHRQPALYIGEATLADPFSTTVTAWCPGRCVSG